MIKHVKNGKSSNLRFYLFFKEVPLQVVHCKYQADAEATEINRKIVNISGVSIDAHQIVPPLQRKLSSCCFL